MFQCPHLQKENYNSTCFLSGCENYITVVEALRMLIPSMRSMNIDYCCYALDVSLFSLFFFFKVLSTLYLTLRSQFFSRIPSQYSTLLTLHTRLDHVILPYVSPRPFTAGFSVLRRLQILWQPQINQLNSILCFETNFSLFVLHSSPHPLPSPYNSNGTEIKQIWGQILA